jgi:hypothetical protein
MSARDHFETKTDACRSASIGLVVLRKLTFWSARNVTREARAPFHAASIVVQFGSSDLEAPRRGRRTTAGQARQPC